MADYQSLLSRAVANLPNTSAAAARQAIYDRARNALVTQLRSLRPPLPDSDIEREERALDKAIAQVELQFAPSEAEREAPAAAGAAPSHPPLAAPKGGVMHAPGSAPTRSPLANPVPASAGRPRRANSASAREPAARADATAAHAAYLQAAH